jgi:hypothetical protein
MHGREAARMREDRQVVEHHVAMRVIEMTVGVDQHAQRLCSDCADRLPEPAAEPRSLLGIDDERAVGRLDRAGVGIAAGADPGMDTGRDRQESGFVGHDERATGCRCDAIDGAS